MRPTCCLGSIVGCCLALHVNVPTSIDFIAPFGTQLAAVAAELRWERLAGLLGVATIGGWLTRYPYTGVSIGGLGTFSWYALDIAADECLRAQAAQAALWGAPAHIACALACATFTLLAVNLLDLSPRPPLGLHVGPGLLILGLAWNLFENGARASWVWDWIEMGPVLFVGCWALVAHQWGVTSTVAALGAYVAFLQISRAALLVSAHHLQPPLTVHGWTGADEYLGLVSSAVRYVGIIVTCVWCSSRAVEGRSVIAAPTLAPTPASAPRDIWRMHVCLSMAAVIAVAPLWLATDRSSMIASWFWCGWGGLVFRRLPRRAAAVKC